MNLRTLIALNLGKFLTLLIKAFGGGATSAPGLFAELIDPQILTKLSTNLEAGAILITGTNGKTTTSRILSSILQTANLQIVHNRSGSNLTRGLITQLIKAATSSGKIKEDLALFEVDEATLPKVVAAIHPKAIVINNLFRDQLDRYGEVDIIRKKWSDALRFLGKETTLILNSDDPLIASLAKNAKTNILFFGLKDKKNILKKAPHAVDALLCPECSNELKFDYFYISHMGKFFCPNCRFSQPQAQIYANFIKLFGPDNTNARIFVGNNGFEINLKLGGLYNIYNTLAAVSAAVCLGLSLHQIKEGLDKFEVAFGRLGKIKIGEKYITSALVKNPVGFNETLRLLFSDKKEKNLLIIINDLIADGRDVSWLWDVDFETLKDFENTVTVSGTRYLDMKLRLKYAQITNVASYQNLEEAFQEAVEKTKKEETLYILPTYTAMLKLREILAKKGLVKRFWED